MHLAQILAFRDPLLPSGPYRCVAHCKQHTFVEGQIHLTQQCSVSDSISPLFGGQWDLLPSFSEFTVVNKI